MEKSRNSQLTYLENWLRGLNTTCYLVRKELKTNTWTDTLVGVTQSKEKGHSVGWGTFRLSRVLAHSSLEFGQYIGSLSDARPHYNQLTP